MSGSWRALGSGPPGPIVGVAIASSGRFVVASLAGIAVSGNGGESWGWPLPGEIGPFVRDVAILDDRGNELLVAAPGRLYRSADGGASWSAVALDVNHLATTHDGGALLVLGDGGVAHAVVDRETVRVRRIPAPPDVSWITVSPRDGTAWLVAGGRLHRTDDRPTSWRAFDGPDHTVSEQIGVLPDGDPLVLAVDGSLHRLRGGWETVSDAGPDPATHLAVAVDAPVVALAGGRTARVLPAPWERFREYSLDATVTSLAVTRDGAAVCAGLADGTCAVIDLAKGTLHRLMPGSSGMVTSIHASAEVLAVAGFGACAWSRDGLSWTPWTVSDPVEAAVIVTSTGTERIAAFGPAGLADHRGTVVAPPPPGDVRLAAWRDGSGQQVATSDGATVWRKDDGARPAPWKALPTMQDEARIVALAYGSPGDDVPELLIAATIGQQDQASLWAWHGNTWHMLANGDCHHRVVPIAAIAGPRGLHAAIGDTLLRPATVGQLVLAAEHPPVQGDPIVGLAACVHSELRVLVVLAGRRLLVSMSGGLHWTGIEPPDGPPVTAIALRGGATLELLAAQLGGALRVMELAPG
jgi:hypothetical protein